MYEIEIYNKAHGVWYSLDLSDEFVAITYQSTRIAEIKETANFSKQIELMYSENNLKALDYLQIVENQTLSKYRLFPANVYIDGTIVMQEALLRIIGVKNDRISVQVFDSKKLFVSILKELGSLNDLEWDTTQGGNNNPNFVNNSPFKRYDEPDNVYDRKNVHWQIADFSTSPYGSGSITDKLTTFDNSPLQTYYPCLFLEGQVPFVRFHAVLDEIMRNAGYTYDIDFLNVGNASLTGTQQQAWDYYKIATYQKLAFQLANKLPSSSITANMNFKGESWTQVGKYQVGSWIRGWVQVVRTMVNWINTTDTDNRLPENWQNLGITAIPSPTLMNTNINADSIFVQHGLTRLKLRGITDGLRYTILPYIKFNQSGWYKIRAQVSFTHVRNTTNANATAKIYPSIGVIESYDPTAGGRFGTNYEQEPRIVWIGDKVEYNLRDVPSGFLNDVNTSPFNVPPTTVDIQVHATGDNNVCFVPHLTNTPDGLVDGSEGERTTFYNGIWDCKFDFIFVEYIEDGSSASEDQRIPIKRNLPDMTCDKYLNEFTKICGQMYYVDEREKHVFFYDLDTLIRNASNGNFLNWTDKLNKGTGNVNFTLLNYAKANYLLHKSFTFKFNTDSNNRYYAPITHGEARELVLAGKRVYFQENGFSTGFYNTPFLIATRETVLSMNGYAFFVAVAELGESYEYTDKSGFAIDNESLQDELDYVKTEFASAVNTKIQINTPTPNKQWVAKIPVVDIAYEDSNTTPYYGHVNRSNAEVTLNTGETPRLVTLESTSGCFFMKKWNKSYANDSLTSRVLRTTQCVKAETLLMLYYRILRDNVLKNVIEIQEAEFLLTAEDVSNYKPYIPIYLEQYGAFFYVDVIKDFVNGKLTKVNLIRIKIQ